MSKQANAGSFKKGRSGNPGGRPKTIGEVRDAARAHTAEAIETLAKWMRSGDAKASVAAANALLDRGWGRATQPMTGEEGESPLKTHRLIEMVIVDPKLQG